LQHSGKADNHRKNLWGSVSRSSALAIASFLLLSCGVVNAQQTSSSAEAVDAAREVVQQSPENATARYKLGRALRLAGKNQEAASELLEATSVEPSLYVAYHELSLTKARPQQIDEAIDRLTILKDEKPKDLMLRIALSELLEQNGKTYQASRILVDLVYQNAVPEKYAARVAARIHYLLGKAKDTHATEKAATQDSAQDAAEEESLPAPLPETSLRRNLAASKIKDSKTGQGFGHAPLLP
jgi:predicted O-linked N-acetylglucosamine transferase (SPINDLY family)